MLAVDLSSSRVAITQGASGIGLAAATLFAQAGAAVALCGRDAAQLRQASESLRLSCPAARLITQQGDPTSASDMRHFALAASRAFGGVDLLVANTGESRQSSLAATDPARWLEQIEQKLFALISPVRAFQPLLVKSPAAAVVCVNSALAYAPEHHLAAASAGCASVQNLVRSLATELAPQQIRVNAVLVGLQASSARRARCGRRDGVQADWPHWEAGLAERKGVLLGRLGQTAEVAQAIFCLGTPWFAYTTGSHIDVTGGLLPGG